MTTKRPQTPNRGAADERAAILRKVRAELKKAKDVLKDVGTEEAAGEVEALSKLAEWIADRDIRTAQKAGGLGRVKAKKGESR